MKTLLLAFFALISASLCAQENTNTAESLAFKGEFRNEEHNVTLTINLADKDILIAGQEILGELDGYFHSPKTSHVWAITSSAVSGNTATIEVINNYGSEDFTALLTQKDQNTLEYKHLGGSTFKFPVEKKWQKIPSKITFKRIINQ